MAVSINFVGLGTVQNYIGNLPKRMNADTLHTLDTWGKEFCIVGKALSPEDKIRQFDNRRRPASQQFKLYWKYDLAATDTRATLRIGNTDPRMPLIVFPTRPRAIPTGGFMAQAQKGYQMRFYFNSGQMAKRWVIRGGVAAHGTPGNPVHEKMVQNFDWPGNMQAFGVLLVRP